MKNGLRQRAARSIREIVSALFVGEIYASRELLSFAQNVECPLGQHRFAALHGHHDLLVHPEILPLQLHMAN